MKVKLILPALTEAISPFWQPIRYSRFPPLGLASIAAHFSPKSDRTLQDEHVEPPYLNDKPNLVVIQVDITNAYCAYQLADHHRQKGACVTLEGRIHSRLYRK